MNALHLIYPDLLGAEDLADRLQAYMVQKAEYIATAFVKPIKHPTQNLWRNTIDAFKISPYEAELITNVLTPQEVESIVNTIDASWYDYPDL